MHPPGSPSSPPAGRARRSRVGDVISGRYRIEGEIGRGGMGRVYRAQHIELGRPVAVKILEPQREVPHAAKRFIREARVTAGLNHPNIVNVLDFGHTQDEAAFIVMEFLSGKDLAKIARHNPVSWDQARHYLEQLCRGLQQAHAAGLVHRDLKPENCIVGEDDVLKILDFGIAKNTDANTTALTGVGSLMGTPEYMSPEQARGAAELDHRTDIYAVGIIAYELLTGDVPFTGRTVMDVLMQHVKDPPPPPSDRNPAIPARGERIILKALAKRPEDRFQSVGELLQALGQVASFAPPAPPRATVAMSTSTSASNSDMGPVVRTGLTRVASSSFPVVPQRAPTNYKWVAAAITISLVAIAAAAAWVMLGPG